MHTSIVLRYPKITGLAGILGTQKIIENKGKVCTAIIVIAETVNAISTGDIIIPETPFSVDPMFDSVIFEENRSTLNNNNQSLHQVEEPKSQRATEKTKIQPNYVVSRDDVGPAYIVRLNDQENNQSISVNLRRPDVHVYYSTYDQGFDQTLELSLEQRKEGYRIMYEDRINNRINNIADIEEYNRAIMTVNFLTFAFPLHVTERNISETNDYIHHLIELIEAKPEFRINFNDAFYQWRKLKRDFIAQQIISLTNNETLSSLRRSNVNEILREHHQLFEDAEKEYSKRIEEKRSISDSSSSSRATEEILELRQRMQTLQEKEFFSAEIQKAQDEALNTAREELNSIRGRCLEMIKNLDEVANNIKDVITNLKMGPKLKLSFMIGTGAVAGFAALNYVITNKKPVFILISSAYKLMFGAAKKTASVIKETAKKPVVDNINKKVTEKIVNNTLKDNLVAGVSAVELAKLVEKIRKYTKK